MSIIRNGNKSTLRFQPLDEDIPEERERIKYKRTLKAQKKKPKKKKKKVIRGTKFS